MVTIRRILVPIDFTEGSDLALSNALALAAPMGAEVHALHVWQPPPHFLPDMMVNMPGEAELTFDEFMHKRTLHELEVFVRAQRANTTVEVVTHVETGTPREVILRYLEANPMDLVVMSTQGRTGLAHALLGSVAEHVVRHQPCPVMTVRAPDGT